MTALISLDDLRLHMGAKELEQLAGVGSHNSAEGRALDMDTINAAIGFASEMALSYLGERHPQLQALALADVPSLLKAYLSDIVRHRLRARSGKKNAVSEEVEKRADKAEAWLKDIAAGNARLDLPNLPGVSDGHDPHAGAMRPVLRTYAEETQARDLLDGYV